MECKRNNWLAASNNSTSCQVTRLEQKLKKIDQIFFFFFFLHQNVLGLPRRPGVRTFRLQYLKQFFYRKSKLLINSELRKPHTECALLKLILSLNLHVIFLNFSFRSTCFLINKNNKNILSNRGSYLKIGGKSKYLKTFDWRERKKSLIKKCFEDLFSCKI